MDDKGRMATAAATSFAGADSANAPASSQEESYTFSLSPRPPPLPLSTSSFAFEQPSLDSRLDESGGVMSPRPNSSTEDASVSFIHQPNPDYSGDSTSSATASTPTPLVTDAVVEHSISEDAPLSPFIEMMGDTQHTQAYGGGVCLACLAAVNSGTLSEEDGPMYGENVPLEDRRQPWRS
ncbi:hypothetical protein SBRCBS47491_006214 [Sporothrix bragantina]|uniref:Uncharacterized protein n=1 Tax=Sporothrix bragantina TaxID=671064 RepID=A0ABP0C5E4_9PEZI